LHVDACAIDPEVLRINGSMGSSFAISGQVDQLDAELSMGAKFNDDTDALHVRKATVSVAMGAQANLCGARQVSGNAAMGAMVYVGSDAQNDINAAMGAAVKRRDCKNH